MPDTVKPNLADFESTISKLRDPERAIISQRFFKTLPGQYGHGDIFIGLTVPQCRLIAKRYYTFSIHQVTELLHSPIHEYRLIALIILIYQFRHQPEDQQNIYDFYLQNTTYINNWDLVDLSAPNIVGQFLLSRDRQILVQLAKSTSLWERRIAIIATMAFIAKGEYQNTFQISKILLTDRHDLIHKAVGWMLREVGKRCGQEIEEEFLRQHYHHMPRTMLRYAIERFPESLRQRYLLGRA